MSINLRDIAYNVSQNDFLHGFGIRTKGAQKHQIESPKSWLDLALRVSHWTPIGMITGFISLGIVGRKIYLQQQASNKEQISNNDWSEVARAIAAITCATLLIAIIDVATTYARMQGAAPQTAH